MRVGGAGAGVAGGMGVKRPDASATVLIWGNYVFGIGTNQSSLFSTKIFELSYLTSS